MIFKDWQAVLNGRKIHTRRVKQEGERLVMRDGARTVLTPGGRVKWQVGRTYAIQPPSQIGRGQPSKGCFELLDIRGERVQDISNEDAQAEGIRSHPECGWYYMGMDLARWYREPRFAFCDLWNDIWRRRPEWQWKSNPEVWVLVMRV